MTHANNFDIGDHVTCQYSSGCDGSVLGFDNEGGVVVAISNPNAPNGTDYEVFLGGFLTAAGVAYDSGDPAESTPEE